MSDGVFATICIGVMLLFITGLFWIILAHPQPCEGGWSFHGQTGIYHYQGKTIRCFHGQVVEVRP